MYNKKKTILSDRNFTLTIIRRTIILCCPYYRIITVKSIYICVCIFIIMCEKTRPRVTVPYFIYLFFLISFDFI